MPATPGARFSLSVALLVDLNISRDVHIYSCVSPSEVQSSNYTRAVK